MTKHRNNKEHAILEAARQEFLEKGYDGARTTSIARNAGVTHAMLHYYFKTKEDLFCSIFVDFIAQIGKNLTSLFEDSQKPFVELIENAMSMHFDFISENPKVPLFIIREIWSRPERIEMLRQSISSTVGGLLASAQQAMDVAKNNGEINSDIVDAPEKINEDPYGSWFVVAKDVSFEKELLDAKAYEEFVQEA